MTIYYGSAISSTWSVYINHTSTTTANDKVTYKFVVGIYGNAKHSHTLKYETLTVNWWDKTSHKYTYSSYTGEASISKGEYFKLYSGTFVANREHSARTVAFGVSLNHSGTGAKWKGTSGREISFTVPAKPSYAVKYNANKPSDATATPTGIPSAQTKWWGESLTLSSTTPTISDKRFSFKCWNTQANGKGTNYNKGATYTGNTALTLYAIWNRDFPPSVGGSFSLTNFKNGTSGVKGFSGLKVNVTGLTAYESRTLGTDSVVVTVGSQTLKATPTLKSTSGTVKYYNDLELEFSTLNASGSFAVFVTVKDSAGKQKQLVLKSVSVINPTWTRTVTINEPPPEIVKGNGVLDKLEVYDYTAGAYKTITGSFPVTIVSDNEWTFQYTFNASQVDPESADMMMPTTKVRVSYKHYDVVESEARSSFFRTSRNQNYSNGIYNVMFVSGAIDYPAFTSRVWWSQINNPLYFPDTNYIEVGSNDTMVMGLTKVGDYLAVIKQSKTTDTAIYLLFPTSFEEDTTFAVKQGVQGVGALARYSFNILGDETLFLSPQGVMAIVPSQDEEHKVQNRSYFIDGKLLKEPNISEAYSFVHDGKYYLAVNEQVYVLDGNQRNSWGNDRTNLVYECYYLNNVPAKCFVKYNDQLVFSNDENVCIVGDGFEDAYDVETQEPNTPVKAEWSTLLDDDGSLHYYKTMQKKGNLVSILPNENERPYKDVIIDEDTFNENKTMYFVLVDDEYVRCTEDSVYDPDTQYYIENRTNTKVFVKKDGNDEVEIERSFSISSDIPSEMFLKKKFKKYKRLQFIIRNEAPEAFGVDSIIKNYTVGNYAKK